MLSIDCLVFFWEEDLFHKTKLQKNHTYYYKKQKMKTKKKLEILKEGKERSGGSHYIIVVELST